MTCAESGARTRAASGSGPRTVHVTAPAAPVSPAASGTTGVDPACSLTLPGGWFHRERRHVDDPRRPAGERARETADVVGVEVGQHHGVEPVHPEPVQAPADEDVVGPGVHQHPPSSDPTAGRPRRPDRRRTPRRASPARPRPPGPPHRGAHRTRSAADRTSTTASAGHRRPGPCRQRRTAATAPRTRSVSSTTTSAPPRRPAGPPPRVGACAVNRATAAIHAAHQPAGHATTAAPAGHTGETIVAARPRTVAGPTAGATAMFAGTDTTLTAGCTSATTGPQPPAPPREPRPRRRRPAAPPPASTAPPTAGRAARGPSWPAPTARTRTPAPTTGRPPAGRAPRRRRPGSPASADPARGRHADAAHHGPRAARWVRDGPARRNPPARRRPPPASTVARTPPTTPPGRGTPRRASCSTPLTAVRWVRPTDRIAASRSGGSAEVSPTTSPGSNPRTSGDRPDTACRNPVRRVSDSSRNPVGGRRGPGRRPRRPRPTVRRGRRPEPAAEGEPVAPPHVPPPFGRRRTPSREWRAPASFPRASTEVRRTSRTTRGGSPSRRAGRACGSAVTTAENSPDTPLPRQVHDGPRRSTGCAAGPREQHERRGGQDQRDPGAAAGPAQHPEDDQQQEHGTRERPHQEVRATRRQERDAHAPTAAARRAAGRGEPAAVRRPGRRRRATARPCSHAHQVPQPLEHLRSDALHLAEVVDGREPAVLLAPGDDPARQDLTHPGRASRSAAVAEFRSTTRAPGVPDEPPRAPAQQRFPAALAPGRGPVRRRPGGRARGSARRGPRPRPAARCRQGVSHPTARGQGDDPRPEDAPATWTTTEAELVVVEGDGVPRGVPPPRPARSSPAAPHPAAQRDRARTATRRTRAPPPPGHPRGPHRATARARPAPARATARNPVVRSASAATTHPRHPETTPAGPAVRRTRLELVQLSSNASSNSSWSAGSSPRDRNCRTASRGRGAPHRDGRGAWAPGNLGAQDAPGLDGTALWTTRPPRAPVDPGTSPVQRRPHPDGGSPEELPPSQQGSAIQPSLLPARSAQPPEGDRTPAPQHERSARRRRRRARRPTPGTRRRDAEVQPRQPPTQFLHQPAGHRCSRPLVLPVANPHRLSDAAGRPRRRHRNRPGPRAAAAPPRAGPAGAPRASRRDRSCRRPPSAAGAPRPGRPGRSGATSTGGAAPRRSPTRAPRRPPPRGPQEADELVRPPQRAVDADLRRASHQVEDEPSSVGRSSP